MVKNDGYDYMICGHNVLCKNYVWGAVLANKFVCMVDESYRMRLETFENLFSNRYTDSKKQVFGGEIQLPEALINNCRTVCVKEDGSITRTSQERLRVVANGIGYVFEHNVVKVTLLSFEELAHRYLDKNEDLKALLLLSRLSNNQISARENDRKSINKIMPDFVNFYLEKFPQELRNSVNDPEVKSQEVETLRTAIRCCIEALVRT